MYFRDLIGHTALKARLIDTAQRGIVPHAQLFTSRDGEGALAMAYAYARYLNCQAPSPTDACGACPSCQRFDEVGDPDLFFLFPIINNGGKNLCEDLLPQWRSFLQQGAYSRYSDWLRLLGSEGKKASIFTREGEGLQRQMSYHLSGKHFRILLLWLPERMQEALANKLLKLVEEPPEDTLIFMVSLEEQAVLPTLRSRMQTIRLQPLSTEEITEALRALPHTSPSEDALYAAHMSGGNFRLARDLYLGTSDELSQELDLLKRTLRATVNAQPLEMRTLAEELAGLSKDEQVSFVDYLARMFRELYLFNLNLPQINYLARQEEGIANYLRGCITGKNIRQIQEELDLASRHLAQQVNAKLVFFDLLLRLTSLLAASYKQAGIR